MKIIERNSLVGDCYRLVLDTEYHHDHQLVKDESGVIRWKHNNDVLNLREHISLNYLCPLLESLGYGKNSEIYRKLYRDMGYSLSGYWEIFYWEVNNPEWSEYIPNKN